MSYHEPRHSMSVVTRRTGLTSHAVRVWEKRYNAVSPGRTGTNRRLYSDADIDRLRLLHAVTLAGHSIGTVAHAGNEQLEQLLKDAAHLKPLLRTVESPSGVEEGGLRDALFARACAAIEGFEDVALEQVLREANAVFSRPILLDQLLTPLLEWLGQGWQSGRLRVAHEHFASALIRNFLITLRSSYGAQESAPVLVVATPVGQHHEIGALIVAEIAASEGWHVVYMGPGLPAEDIGLIARARHAAAIALSIVYPTDDPQLARDLRELDRRYLPADTALIVGGSGAAGYRAVLEETAAQVVTDMESLRRVLAAAREQRARNVLSSI